MKIHELFHYCKVRLFILFLFAGIVLNSSALAGESKPVILAFGDSLTAGFGLPEEESYPSRLQEILELKGFPYKVVNAGVTGDTTAGGVRRINWLMQHRPKIVILALGANDGLRGLPLDEMEANLEKIIQLCLEKNAKVLLAGMKVLPNYGEEYQKGFADVFSRLKEKHQLVFLPFLLEGVAGVRKYTRPDGIHPQADGYKLVAKLVWQYLQPMLEKGSD
jgi:acyl-CoA thioesterase-1